MGDGVALFGVHVVHGKAVFFVSNCLVAEAESHCRLTGTDFLKRRAMLWMNF